MKKILDEELFEFDILVLEGLKKCNVPLIQKCGQKLRIGAGVSGGADSVSLLVSLCRLSKIFCFEVFAISVNHNIRSEEESLADSEYVLQLCGKLKEMGFCVSGEIANVAKGLIDEVAVTRGNGTEDAARFVRYGEFEKFCNSHDIDYFCLAHNENDQVETVLMRFLQGSAQALGGIKVVRGIFVRPLLGIERSVIESYLKSLEVEWKTDSTNLQNTYFRNKVRNVMVPFLNQNFPGWKQGVLSLSQKAKDDEEAMSWLYEKQLGSTRFSEKIPVVSFLQLPVALRILILYERLTRLGCSFRFPYRILRIFAENPCKISALGFDFFADGEFIFVKKAEKRATESSFFAIIEEDGRYEFPFGFLNVESHGKDVNACFENAQNGNVFAFDGMTFPFCVRSQEISDYVFLSDGRKKSLADVFSDWHVPSDKKKCIPVVQSLADEDMKILCVAGSVFGYPDWISRG